MRYQYEGKVIRIADNRYVIRTLQGRDLPVDYDLHRFVGKNVIYMQQKHPTLPGTEYHVTQA